MELNQLKFVLTLFIILSAFVYFLLNLFCALDVKQFPIMQADTLGYSDAQSTAIFTDFISQDCITDMIKKDTLVQLLS